LRQLPFSSAICRKLLPRNFAPAGTGCEGHYGTIVLQEAVIICTLPSFLQPGWSGINLSSGYSNCGPARGLRDPCRQLLFLVPNAFGSVGANYRAESWIPRLASLMRVFNTVGLPDWGRCAIPVRRPPYRLDRISGDSDRSVPCELGRGVVNLTADIWLTVQQSYMVGPSLTLEKPAIRLSGRGLNATGRKVFPCPITDILYSRDAQLASLHSATRTCLLSSLKGVRPINSGRRPLPRYSQP
jgi:hypothetical protein